MDGRDGSAARLAGGQILKDKAAALVCGGARNTSANANDKLSAFGCGPAGAAGQNGRANSRDSVGAGPNWARRPQVQC